MLLSSMKKLILIGFLGFSLEAYACVQENAYSLHYFFVATLFTSVFLAFSSVYLLRDKHFFIRFVTWVVVAVGVWLIALLFPSVLTTECSIPLWLNWFFMGISFTVFVVSVYVSTKKA